MSYSKRTHTFQSIFFSRGMALVVVFLAIFIGFGVVSVAEKSISVSRDRKLAEAQAAALTIKNTAMAKRLAELGTDDGKEAALREQFPVVKPGEHVVVITDASSVSDTDASVSKDTASKSGFWNFLRSLF